MNSSTPGSRLKVSVVMCTYNGETYVGDQINSIISQTYPLHELLIFDDASSDNTVQLVTQMAHRHPLIKVIVNEKNIGFIKNFEQAIHAAEGDVIAIADQDDIWVPEKIKKMIAVWKPGYPLIYCNSFVFSGTPPDHPPGPVFRQFEGTDARRIFLFNTVSGHALLIKKEFVPLVLPFEKDVMYDWWMSVVAAYNGGVQHHDEVLVYHRSHGKNITVNALSMYNKAEQRYYHKKLLINQALKFATAPNIPLSHKNFLLQYSRLLNQSLHINFYKPLFLFMFRNRRYFFSYKKRRIGIISHLKHSYLRTLTQLYKINLDKPLFKNMPN